MNKKLFLLSFIVVATAMLATSCQKEEGTVTLGAEIQKPVSGNAKVYIDEHTPCWHNGDEVFINNTAYPIMAATGSTARIENVVSASTYRAIFPASIVPTGSDISSSGSIPVTLPSSQQYELVGSHQLVNVPMGAYLTSGSTLQFYNLCSIVRVIVSNSLNRELQLSRIELQAQTAKLSGSGTATVSGQASDRINLSNSAQNHVCLAFSNDNPSTVEARSTSTFDIVVPAFTTDDVTITLYTSDGYMSEVEKNDVVLAHNTITTVTLNVTSLAEAPHAELVSGATFNAAIPDEATSVVFEYNSIVSSGTLLSTANSPVPIYGNLDGTVWRVSTSDRKMNANPNCSGMFRKHGSGTISELLPQLETIDFGSGFNTSNVTNMSGMFEYCTSLTNLDVSNFNTENVTNMSSMFNYCSSLTHLNLSNFSTENVTDMNAMFACCFNLTSLNISNFNTENVTNMRHMFHSCYMLTSLNLSNFNTENVTDMSYILYGCSRLTSLNLSNFNTENVTNMTYMFSHCSSLTSLNLSNFNTENVTDMSWMFYYCNSLTSLNLSSFYTTSVNNMQAMFKDCWSLTSLNLAHFDMSHLTSHSYYTGGEYQTLSGKYDMCLNLSTTSHSCTITCPLVVQTEIQAGTGLPTSGVTFTWLRP